MMLIYPEKYLVPSRGDHRALTKQAVHQGQMLLSQTRSTGAGVTIKLAVQEQLLEQGSSSAQPAWSRRLGESILDSGVGMRQNRKIF